MPNSGPSSKEEVSILASISPPTPPPGVSDPSTLPKKKYHPKKVTGLTPEDEQWYAEKFEEYLDAYPIKMPRADAWARFITLSREEVPRLITASGKFAAYKRNRGETWGIKNPDHWIFEGPAASRKYPYQQWVDFVVKKYDSPAPLQEIVDTYHRICIGHPPIVELPKDAQLRLEQMYFGCDDDDGTRHDNMAWWEGLCYSIVSHKRLNGEQPRFRGRNGEGTCQKVSLLWIIQPKWFQELSSRGLEDYPE